MEPRQSQNTETDSKKKSDRDAAPSSGTPVLAITAIALSLCALAVSVFEVSTIRDEQRIQVWPYVGLNEHYGPEGFSIEAKNKGIGPARVRSVSLRFQGEVYEDLDELILKAVGQENAFSYDLYRTADPTGAVMSPEEEVVLFGVPWEPRTRLLVERLNNAVELELCYCSVYDECWLSRLGEGDPAPVDRCPAP